MTKPDDEGIPECHGKRISLAESTLLLLSVRFKSLFNDVNYINDVVDYINNDVDYIDNDVD